MGNQNSSQFYWESLIVLVLVSLNFSKFLAIFVELWWAYQQSDKAKAKESNKIN